MLKLFAIVPIKKFESAKSRLGSVLSIDERIMLSQLLFEDTLKILKNVAVISEIVVVSSDKEAKKIAEQYGITFLKEHLEKGVNAAVKVADEYSIKAKADATIVVPQDLPLLTVDDIATMYQILKAHDKCLIICPSTRFDGSNLLARKPPQLLPSTSYDVKKNSYYMHISSAMKLGVYVRIFLSHGAMKDIDTPDDVESIISELNDIDRPSSQTYSSALFYLKSKFFQVK